MLSMAYSRVMDCIWRSLRVMACNPDALLELKATNQGRVPRSFFPGVIEAKLSHWKGTAGWPELSKVPDLPSRQRKSHRWRSGPARGSYAKTQHDTTGAG